jgi:hypothetical protein
MSRVFPNGNFVAYLENFITTSSLSFRLSRASMPILWPVGSSAHPSYRLVPQYLSILSLPESEGSQGTGPGSDPESAPSLHPQPCRNAILFFTAGFWVLLFMCLFEALALTLHSSIFTSTEKMLTKTPVPHSTYPLAAFPAPWI